MIVSDLSCSELCYLLETDGIKIEIGPFVIGLVSDIPDVAQNIHVLYSQYVLSESAFVDFYIRLKKPTGFRRFIRPQVNFDFDGMIPFKPLPYAQSFALFEWGLNWCVASYAHQYLILHSAVVERNGYAAILPGNPGAGKSTLCAALIHHGWRLLSDEMSLISPGSLSLVPIPRPVSLKNESIDVISSFVKNVQFGLLADDTHKGKITHIKAPSESIVQSSIAVEPKWMIFPRYKSDVSLRLSDLKKGTSFIWAAEQGFNYNVLGEDGFNLLGDLISKVDTYELEYSVLDEAIEAFDSLAEAVK